MRPPVAARRGSSPQNRDRVGDTQERREIKIWTPKAIHSFPAKPFTGDQREMLISEKAKQGETPWDTTLPHDGKRSTATEVGVWGWGEHRGQPLDTYLDAEICTSLSLAFHRRGSSFLALLAVADIAECLPCGHSSSHSMLVPDAPLTRHQWNMTDASPSLWSHFFAWGGCLTFRANDMNSVGEFHQNVFLANQKRQMGKKSPFSFSGCSHIWGWCLEHKHVAKILQGWRRAHTSGECHWGSKLPWTHTTSGFLVMGGLSLPPQLFLKARPFSHL